MKAFALVSALLFASALGACSTTPEAEDAAPVADLPCICGEPEAMLSGCPHPLCIEEKGNPDNPDCACGTLSFDEKN